MESAVANVLQNLSGSIGAGLTPSAGSVVPARKLRPDEDSMAGRSFVWVEGELKGRQEQVDYTLEQNGKYSVVFKSGIQLLMEELNLKLVEADQYKQSIRKTDGLIYEDELGLDDIRPSRMNRGLDNNVPVQMEAYVPDKIEGLEYIDPPKRTNTSSQVTSQQSPLIVLLEKMKTGPTKVSLDLELNIPSKEVYNMLISTFDGAEEDIIDYLFTGKNFRDLKVRFIEALNNYYGVVKTPVEPTEIENNKSN